MSSPDINERDGSAELDVALTTEKEAAGISSQTLSLSTSTVGLNPINNEIELRDEAQPAEEVALDDALGDTREGAEEVAEEVGIPEDVSVAPSLAPSLAP